MNLLKVFVVIVVTAAAMVAEITTQLAEITARRQDQIITITSDRKTRHAKLHLPPKGEKSIALVIMLHHMSGTPEMAIEYTGFSDLADTEGFAVMYPIGLADTAFSMGGYTFNAGACCPKACAEKIKDVQFMRDLVKTVKDNMPILSGKLFTVDPKRVYLTGSSNGAFMTNRIGCEAHDLFAAIAPVSGIIANGESNRWKTDPYECPDAVKALPALYFHGKEDDQVPWAGNGAGGFGSVKDYVDHMKVRNKLQNQQGVVTFQQGAVTCTAYGNDASNFTFCQHSEGHCWPSGSAPAFASTSTFPKCPSRTIDATSQIWAFFKRHR